MNKFKRKKRVGRGQIMKLGSLDFILSAIKNFKQGQENTRFIFCKDSSDDYMEEMAGCPAFK